MGSFFSRKKRGSPDGAGRMAGARVPREGKNVSLAILKMEVGSIKEEVDVMGDEEVVDVMGDEEVVDVMGEEEMEEEEEEEMEEEEEEMEEEEEVEEIEVVENLPKRLRTTEEVMVDVVEEEVEEEEGIEVVEDKELISLRQRVKVLEQDNKEKDKRINKKVLEQENKNLKEDVRPIGIYISHGLSLPELVTTHTVNKSVTQPGNKIKTSDVVASQTNLSVPILDKFPDHHKTSITWNRALDNVVSYRNEAEVQNFVEILFSDIISCTGIGGVVGREVSLPDGSVDCMVCEVINGRKVFVLPIEVKLPGESTHLCTHQVQLLRYMCSVQILNESGVAMGVLTDGVHWIVGMLKHNECDFKMEDYEGTKVDLGGYTHINNEPLLLEKMTKIPQYAGTKEKEKEDSDEMDGVSEATKYWKQFKVSYSKPMRINEENKPHQVARMLLNVVHNARRAVKLTSGQVKGDLGDDGEVLKRMVCTIKFKGNKRSYALRNLNNIDLVNPVYPNQRTEGFYLCKEFHTGQGNRAYLATTSNHSLCVIKTRELPPTSPSFSSDLRSLFNENEVKQILKEAIQPKTGNVEDDDMQAEDGTVFYQAVKTVISNNNEKASTLRTKLEKATTQHHKNGLQAELKVWNLFTQHNKSLKQPFIKQNNTLQALVMPYLFPLEKHLKSLGEVWKNWEEVYLPQVKGQLRLLWKGGYIHRDLLLRHVGLWKHEEKVYVQLFDFGRMERVREGKDMNTYIIAEISRLSVEVSNL